MTRPHGAAEDRRFKIGSISAMSKAKKSSGKAHPWRMCPQGQHWVRNHQRRTPKGSQTTVHGHCRANPSQKDQIYSFELAEISKRHFNKVRFMPSSDDLGYRRGNEYDRLIAGWTKYWNEVLKPEHPLRPNLVKALIATESSFNPKAKALASKRNWARGLTQVTDQTLRILSDEKGEVRDHLVNID